MKLLLLTSLALLGGTMVMAQPATNHLPDYSAYILTPAAPATPRINSARVFGVRPSSPLLYTIAATGERPMTFSAEGLPAGVKLDGTNGQITGKIKKRGTYQVTLYAQNAKGKAQRDLRIVVGDDILLTPPMGWNSWNCWGNSVSQEKVLSSARAMVEKGLNNYGWTYINVDDGWQGLRGGEKKGIQSNIKFPDMKSLGDELHKMGLKFGIYSGPMVGTYAGHVGSTCDRADGTYEWVEKGLHNENYRVVDPSGKVVPSTYYYRGAYSFANADAWQWAQWGVDYLKYDWHPNDYYYTHEMAKALRSTGRDIVLSLSNNAPFASAYDWLSEAQCWRTTGDIEDTWKSVDEIAFMPQPRWSAFQKPGHWPDADMLVVGMVGWGPNLHPTRLTADEQYTHITMWALISSPMLIGCDMAQLDNFTINLLCNYEVNDVLQDPLGMRAVPYYYDQNTATFVKILDDGSLAVGLFNRSETPQRISFEPYDFGLWSKQITIRDLWRQQDETTIGPHNRYAVEVAPHGVKFVRLSPGNTHDRVINKPYKIE